MPSTEKSRGILDSSVSRTSGSGMDKPAKNSLFLKTFMCLGMRSPAVIAQGKRMRSSGTIDTSSNRIHKGQ